MNCTLYYNARLYGKPQADALLCIDDRIAGIGQADTLYDQLEDQQKHGLERINLGGAWIYPGFQDSHMHLAMFGQALECADLSACTSIDEIGRVLREHAGQSVIHAMGWHQDQLAEKRMLTREDLDALDLGVPIIAQRACTHILCADSLAMKAAGVWKEDGLFRESECTPLLTLCEQNEERQILQAVESCLKRGLTCIHSADLKDSNYRRLLPVFEKASHRIRIHQQAAISDPQTMEDFEQLFARYETPMHTFSAFKGFADGSLGARTAWMKDDYADDPGNRGLCTMDEAAMDAFVQKAASMHRQVLFHAIGDQAAEQVLRVCGRYQDPDNSLRFGIIHLQITDGAILKAVRDQKILALIQPAFWRADQKIVEARVGAAKAASSYAFGTLAGWHLASLSSDCPIEDCDPIQTFHWARALPDALSAEQAIEAMTIGASRTAFREHELGRLEDGYLADLTILSGPLTDSSYPKVINTVISGRPSFPFGDSNTNAVKNNLN